MLCKFKNCNKKSLNERCGNESGYNYFSYDEDLKALEDEFYISVPLRNKSHDLRLAYIFKKHYSNKMFDNDNLDLQDLLDDIYYEDEYGTPEVAENYGSRIKNVEDMRLELEARILDRDDFKNKLESYFTENSDKYTCLGTLNMCEYFIRKMSFIPSCL